MAHIHTEPGQHDHTASAYIVRLDGPEPRVLLVNHRKYHSYIQPGGHVELNETPWQAVLHEITEETGFALTQLKVMQPPVRIKELTSKSVLHPMPVLIQTHQASDRPHYHTDNAFLFLCDGEPNNLPEEGESQDLRWVTLKELTELAETSPISFDCLDVFRYVTTDCLNKWDIVELDEFAS